MRRKGYIKALGYPSQSQFKKHPPLNFSQTPTSSSQHSLRNQAHSSSCESMKLFTISTICALLATNTHAIPGPLVPAPAVPAPALPAPIIEARQLSIPLASVILFGVDNVQLSIQISAINLFVRICTYLHIQPIFT